MVFSGVEILKLQFSRAVDLTFERFLDSWSLGNAEEGPGAMGGAVNGDRFESDVPVNISA
jgi:hypothetical protein